MVSLASALLFGIALIAALATILSSVRAHAPRAFFLLRYGPVIGTELPQPRRATVRGARVRVTQGRAARRAAA